MAGHLPALTARNACHAVFHVGDCPKGQRGERELGASQWSQAGDLRGLWGKPPVAHTLAWKSELQISCELPLNALAQLCAQGSCQGR